MSVSETQRNSLFIAARTLRKFGVVDNFGLGEFVARPRRLPSRSAIARFITENRALLPPGISASFLADHILSDLGAAKAEGGDHRTLLRLVAALPNIPKGKTAATRYQMAVLEIFRLLFEERLGAMKPEETIFTKIKRVDIRAENDQGSGFFDSLRTHHNLLCPSIFFECKNYSEDPDNPAFDQLLARLNPTSTQVGFVVCRKIANEPKARQRCKEAYLREQRMKLMLWLTDADILTMANLRANDGVAAVDAFLKERFDSVTLK